MQRLDGILLLACLVMVTALAGTAQPIVTLQQLPGVIQNGSASLIGHHDPAERLHLALALTPPHMAEEERFLRELADPHSHNFHRYLTSEEWNARFAPSAQDEQAVVDWAKSQGLTVIRRWPNRLTVDVEAPSATVELAFGVAINAPT